MMDHLIPHLDRVRAQLEAEKGPFSFFALFRQPDSADFELMISAPWLSVEKMRGLALVAKLVYSDSLSKTWWSRITRIVTLDESNQSHRALMAAIGPARELRVLDRPQVPGPAIDQAWIIRNDSRPDEERDVIVHYIKERDVVSNTMRDHWLVFDGLERRADVPTSKEALEIANHVASANGRSAWLLDETGYPMKRIGPPEQPRPEDVVMYFINFFKPVPLRGWYVVRGGREEFSETDDAKAENRACALAKSHGVRCFRFRDSEPEEVDCRSTE